MIYDRITVNEKDQTFLPMNVEGATNAKYTSKFWTTEKSMFVVAMIFWLIILSVLTVDTPALGKFFLFMLTFVGYFFLIRFVIFEERFKKQSYLRRKKYSNATSAINWGIMYINDTDLGASVGFAGGNIGCFIKLERGSIVGQPDNYLEVGADLFSEFLKSANAYGYKVKVCKIMDQASKDPRLQYLIDKCREEYNPALRSVLELNTGHMRRLSEYNYFDTDVILIYTKDSMKLNDIVRDALELTSPLLQGTYLTRKVMEESDIIDLHTQINAITYFDVLTAKNEMFEMDKNRSKRDFSVYSFTLDNGNELTLTPEQIKKLSQIYYRYIHDKGAPIDIIKELTEVSGPQAKKDNIQMEEFSEEDINITEKPVDNMEEEPIDLTDTEEDISQQIPNYVKQTEDNAPKKKLGDLDLEAENKELKLEDDDGFEL